MTDETTPEPGGRSDIAPATSFDIPDLSYLFDKNLLNVFLDRVVGNDPGPAAHPQNGMWLNLVRLTDKSIREYQAARDHCLMFQREWMIGHISPLYLAIDHFENAVGAVSRAHLNARNLAPSLTDRSVTLDLLGDDDAKLLADVRNAIQHMDAMLRARSAKAADMYWLWCEKEQLTIRGLTLPYSTLAEWIRKTYSNVELIRGAPSK